MHWQCTPQLPAASYISTSLSSYGTHRPPVQIPLPLSDELTQTNSALQSRGGGATREAMTMQLWQRVQATRIYTSIKVQYTEHRYINTVQTLQRRARGVLVHNYVKQMYFVCTQCNNACHAVQ